MEKRTTDTYTQNVEKGVESVRSSLVVQLDLPSEDGGLVKPLHTSVQKLFFGYTESKYVSVFVMNKAMA